MRKQPRKLVIIVTLAALVLLSGVAFRKEIAVFVFDMMFARHVEQKLAKSYQPIEGKLAAQAAPRPELLRATSQRNMQPFSVLLLGIDQRKQEAGRSDTIIYTVIRPRDDKALMVSIPRDTYAELVGKGRYDKINHAYAFGGKKMIIDSVSKLIDEPVHHYATINFRGFVDVVDALGGVKLPIEQDIVNKEADHEKFRIEGGKPIYSGQEALYYVRYREDDILNRSSRNMVFLNAVLDRMTSVNHIAKIPDLIDTMGRNFATDIEPRMLIGLAKELFQADHREIYSYTIEGVGGRKANNIWYYTPSQKDLIFVHRMIDSWMDPNTPTDQLIVPRTARK